MHTSSCYLAFHWPWKLLVKKLKRLWFTKVLHVCKLLLFLEEIKQPSAKKGPAQSLRNPMRKWVLTIFFPLFLGFLLYYGLALQTSSSFSIRSKRLSISVRFSFAFCCYLSLHLGPFPQISGNAPTFFLQFYHSFMVSSSAQDLTTTGNSIRPQRLEFSAFFSAVGLGWKFPVWSGKVSAKELQSLPETDLPPCLKNLCCTHSLLNLCNKIFWSLYGIFFLFA